ncbi:hypothetical protein M427DRAFT_136893 [Gonapodya prolifera JEL478]|uniref:Uncharacterized protein n=1 Tax=Gonapodya prolifera (strain JEL478) TaxID=1344416 RepID=A0A139A968_GONPJ|nr:hypothetical protein M427DRAFT_136893 [Gonapodya prolifera JEL478]|eukprot:KXS12943.1 hypothetical protein M427DRAFT_136893 [Gonapodya prolifera JEL478]
MGVVRPFPPTIPAKPRSPVPDPAPTHPDPPKAPVDDMFSPPDREEEIDFDFARPTAAASNPKTMYDSRLVNRSAGTSSEFGEENGHPLFFATQSPYVFFKAPPGTGANNHDDDFGWMGVGETEKRGTGKLTRRLKGAEDGAGPVDFEEDVGDPSGLENGSQGKSLANRTSEEQEGRGMMGASTAGQREDYDDRAERRDLLSTGSVEPVALAADQTAGESAERLGTNYAPKKKFGWRISAEEDVEDVEGDGVVGGEKGEGEGEEGGGGESGVDRGAEGGVEELGLGGGQGDVEMLDVERSEVDLWEEESEVDAGEGEAEERARKSWCNII